MSSELQRSVSVPEEVVFRQLDGETVLLNLETGFYFGLDEIGTRIWQLLAQHGRLSDVCKILETEYEAPQQRLEHDLLELVEKLHEHQLVLLHDE